MGNRKRRLRGHRSREIRTGTRGQLGAGRPGVALERGGRTWHPVNLAAPRHSPQHWPTAAGMVWACPLGGDRDSTKIDIDLVARWPRLKAEHHGVEAEHCALDSMACRLPCSGKPTPLQLCSLLISPSPLLTGQVLERIATEFNQLQFHAVQSKGMPLLDKVRPVSVGWGWAVGFGKSASSLSSSVQRAWH